jgi:outer membrane protein
MKKIYCIIAGLFILLPAWAQTDSLKLSLEGAIDLALKNRNEIKIQQINAQVSGNEIRKVNSRQLPQVTSDLDVRYNSRLQTNVLPAHVFNNAEPEHIKFGTPYNTLWGFNLTLPVFNPNDLGDKEIARTQWLYDLLNVQKTEIDIRQQVTESYFGVLLWRERVSLSETNLIRTKAIYEMAQSQYKQGSITSYDLQRNRIDYENAISENTKNNSSLQLALRDLSYNTGEDDTRPIFCSEDLNKLYGQYSDLPTEDQPINRIELSMETVTADIRRMNVKKQNLLYIPTLSVYGNYTLQYLNNSFAPFNSANLYPFNYLGLRASIPIFDGFLKQRTRYGYELQYRSTQLNIEKLRRDYNQEMLNAVTSLRNAQSDFENQKRNLELAEQLYTLDSDRFKNGTIRQNDLSTTYYTLQQTQTNYVNAIYTYLVAMVAYKKAIGGL